MQLTEHHCILGVLGDHINYPSQQSGEQGSFMMPFFR